MTPEEIDTEFEKRFNTKSPSVDIDEEFEKRFGINQDPHQTAAKNITALLKQHSQMPAGPFGTPAIPEEEMKGSEALAAHAGNSLIAGQGPNLAGALEAAKGGSFQEGKKGAQDYLEKNPSFAGDVAGSLPWGGNKAVSTMYGLAQGFGSSKADLSKGELGQLLLDTGKGGLEGLLGATLPEAGLKTAADILATAGKSRLFKAAVGLSSRKFSQIHGKGIMDEAGNYLKERGIGVGDSTGSITDKLSARQDEIKSTLSDTLNDLSDKVDQNVPIDPKDFEVTNAHSRELLHELDLNKELLEHTRENLKTSPGHFSLAGSLADIGLGGALAFAHHPVAGLAGIVARHVGKVYGNAAVGSALIGASKTVNPLKTALPWLVRANMQE